MKRNIQIFMLATSIVVLSCVDDFQDANPPSLLDGPYYTVSLSTDTVTGGESFNFVISVIDAPGGIDTVSITTPDNIGSYSFNNLDAMRGQTEGEITGTFVSPTTFEGDLELSFELFDEQVDEDGDDAAKSLVVADEIYVGFPSGLSEFTLDFPVESFTRGDQFDFEINVTSSPGGIDSIFVLVDNGSVAIDPTDYAGIVGEESGSVTVTYTSNEDYVGEVTFNVNVVDALQQRTSSEDFILTAEYEFAAPEVALTLATGAFKAFTEIPLSVEIISAPGIIDTVFIESYEVTSAGMGDPLGEVELDSTEAANAIGESSAVISGSFISENQGYINIVVTVIDEQGRETTDEMQVLVLPCEIADLAGDYRAVSSGYSADNPVGDYSDLVDTVTIAGNPGNIFDIDDISFGLYPLQGYGAEGGSFVTCDLDVVVGVGDDSIIILSGILNPDGTIEFEWESSYGDTGSTVLTPIP